MHQVRMEGHSERAHLGDTRRPWSGQHQGTGRQGGLLDWDEARVDASVLDLAGVPLDLSDLLDTERLERVRHAADAWEAVNGWIVEPEYARVRLSRLRSA